MAQPKKIKVQVIDGGNVERNHNEMMKYLNRTYKTFGWTCGRKEKWLYGRLRPGRRLRKIPFFIGKCVFWNIDMCNRRDAYYVQETINGWKQKAVFKGTFDKCGEWMDRHHIPRCDDWNIVHETEYDVDE